MKNPAAEALSALTLIALTPELDDAAAPGLAAYHPLLAECVASNQFLNEHTRTHLLQHPSSIVRAAALRLSTDQDVLSARRDSTRELAAVAANPNTPPEVLARLAARGEVALDRELLTNPTTVDATAIAGRYRVSELWATSAGTSGSTQGAVAARRSSGIAAAVAAHPQIARLWWGDPEATTSRVIGYSPHAVLLSPEQLAGKLNGHIRSALATNPALADLPHLCTTANQRAARQEMLTRLGVPADRPATAPAALETLLSTAKGRLRAAGMGQRSVDWALVEHPEMTLDDALVMARRHGTLEAWVIARLVDRFGGLVAHRLLVSQAITRMQAAAVVCAPLRAVLRAHSENRFADIHARGAYVAYAAAAWGSNPDVWSTATRLLTQLGLSLSVEEMTATAAGIAEPARIGRRAA